MARYRTSLILGALAALGLGYIFLVDRGSMTTAQENERKDNLFLRFDDEAIDRLELTAGDRALVLEKRGDAWRMTKPVAAKADTGAVDSLLSTLEFATRERRVEGADVRTKSELGLKSPRVRASFRQKGVTTRFVVGSEDATGNGVYVAVGDEPSAYVVGKDFYEALAKDPSELRDKKLADVRMAEVRRLAIAGGEAPMEIVRDAAGFQMERPTKVRAHATRVEDVLRNVENLRAERFVADGASALGEYGLAPAWRTVTLTIEDKDPVVLRVGTPCEGHEGERHATVVGSGTVACVKGDLLTALEDPPERFRERRLANVRAEDLTQIHLSGGGARVDLKRDGERWKLVRPEEGPADKDAVERMIEELRRIEATEMVPADDLAAKGLAPARYEVVLDLEEGGAPQRIAIGKKEGDFVFARRGDEPAVLRVPAEIEALVRPAAMRFRPKQLLNDDTLDARTLRIESGAGSGAVSQTLEKDDGVWKVTAPVAARADSLATRDLLRRIAELTVERFDADRPEPRHGLSPARLTISARFESDEAQDDEEHPEDADAGPSTAPPKPTAPTRDYQLFVGAKTEGGYFARLDGKDAVFVLPEAFVDDASRPLADRNIFQIDEGSTKKLRLERTGKAPVVLLRDGDAWRREGGGTVDPGKMRDLFDKLSGARALRAQAFGAAAATAGLTAPRAKMTVLREGPPQGEPDEVVFVFGSAVGEAEEAGVHARREDVPATFVLPKDVADAVFAFSP